jgi:hypothetical protein
MVIAYVFSVFTMEFIVANVDNMKFDIEIALEEQYGALPLPFAGMDSTLVLMYFRHILIFIHRIRGNFRTGHRSVYFMNITFILFCHEQMHSVTYSTERCGRVVNTPAPYSGGSQFKSQLRDGLS